MPSSANGMSFVQRIAARRIAEGRDVSDRYERVPPPKMAVAYRNEVATRASASAASKHATSASAEKAQPGARNALSGPTQSSAPPNNLGGLPNHAHSTAGPEVRPETQSASIQALIGAIEEHTAALDRNTAALDRAAGLWP
ncbi:hypothetical protein D6D02_06710 [Aureobasidium pullulans]|uniref:Uncharacterized protein n=1 Tax=Aureobasidium pullulans TaxID=5580 RepID=A0A4S9UTT0_AURPU|nr:hypothetical protein D6D25_00872 [Aureobasidium pullulans]THY09732.1 hypothetical protein D6D02_06710 [Aureobasidium pullulans]THY70433.1 hypothetical protein D6C94_08593 [Aureobasidium pullulans]THY94915.1 hypothetical protein D6C93_05206 [Aureobasidium pullulans]THZ41497.1 hypothetical protein D6C87_05682 [Aureobasidium pullulans]